MPSPTVYIEQLQHLLGALDAEQLSHLADLLEDCWRQGKRVLLAGNGGSAATASHIVNDLQKCIQLDTGRPLKAMCLSDCTPLVLAWANDTSYENVYAPQVECWAEPGDLLIAISGSGNSPNILRAVEAARRCGAHSFGLAGHMGGELASVADECLVVPSTNMQQIEDVHMVVLHLVFSELRERLRAEARQA